MSTTSAPQKRRITIDFLLGVSSAFLSLGVLAVTVVQTNIARGQQYASVWPYLRNDTTSVHKPERWEVTYSIKNKGIGPALIKRIDFRYQDRTYPDYGSLLRGAREPHFSFRETHSSSLVAGDVVQAGEEIELLEVIPDGDVGPFNRLTKDSRFVMTVVFGDVYGNCWVMENERVKSLGSCPD